MKKFVCEMCGSGDLLKEGEFYICQNCGTKYTPDAAKKLMVEGIVSIDRSNELENLYTLARRARNAGNIDDGQKYYEQIIQLVPNDWEAYFFAKYFKLINCNIFQISDVVENIQSSYNITIELINKLPTIERIEAYSVFASHIQSATDKFSESLEKYFDNNLKGKIPNVNEVYELDNYCKKTDKYVNNKSACCRIIIECAKLLEKEDDGKKEAFKLYDHILNSGFKPFVNTVDILQSMKKCDPTFDSESKIQEYNDEKQKQFEIWEEKKKSDEIANREQNIAITTIVIFIIIFIIGFFSTLS